jgi:hypothetical protein
MICRSLIQCGTFRAGSPRPNIAARTIQGGRTIISASRGLTHLTMLAELRLAERILSYGWPLRYLGMPRPYEGGKGVAVAAEIEVGQHVLALTRAKTGILGTTLVEIDPDKLPRHMAERPKPSETFRNIATNIGIARVRSLVVTLANDLAGGAPEDSPQGRSKCLGRSPV